MTDEHWHSGKKKTKSYKAKGFAPGENAASIEGNHKLVNWMFERDLESCIASGFGYIFPSFRT